MVFANGTSGKDWKWAAVKAIEMNKEEKKKLSKKAKFTHKMDMANMVQFDEKDYMEALDYLGLLK